MLPSPGRDGAELEVPCREVVFNAMVVEIEVVRVEPLQQDVETLHEPLGVRRLHIRPFHQALFLQKKKKIFGRSDRWTTGA
jgi:hypothetical protein